jgi:hypothetical protein
MPNLISIEISGWLQANKHKAHFDSTDAIRPTEQQANSDPYLVLDTRVCSHHCASEARFEPTLPNTPISDASDVGWLPKTDPWDSKASWKKKKMRGVKKTISTWYRKVKYNLMFLQQHLIIHVAMF